MSAKTPGLCHSVQLVSPPASSTPRNLHLCLIFQHVKDAYGSQSLTSTETGRQLIIETSEILKDGLIDGIDAEEQKQIKYHSKSCYSVYRLKGRHKSENLKRKSESEDNCENRAVLITPSTNRQKRSNPSKSPGIKEKPCIICDHVKCQGIFAYTLILLFVVGWFTYICFNISNFCPRPSC